MQGCGGLSLASMSEFPHESAAKSPVLTFLMAPVPSGQVQRQLMTTRKAGNGFVPRNERGTGGTLASTSPRIRTRRCPSRLSEPDPAAITQGSPPPAIPRMSSAGPAGGPAIGVSMSNFMIKARSGSFKKATPPPPLDDLKPRRRRCPWHAAKGCRVAHLRFLALAYGRHTIATAGPAFRSHVWLTCEVQSSAEVPGAQVCPGVRGPG